MAGLTAMVGFWATLSLNIPDFSRFAESQRAQIAGQIIGLPLTMLLFAGLGVVLTAASVELTGETISDPINLIGKIDNSVGVVIAMVMIIIATISTNTAANIVSPTNSFQNIAPKYIDENKGVLVTGVIGIVLMSFELMKKLADSKRVEQVFVRHAFRYFIGRNETLADGPTLVAAHKAYAENAGSMKALITSLLTSDAFLYRTSN